MRARIASILLSFPFVACASADFACTTEARASTQVTVVDAAGAIVKDANVSYTANGSAPQQCMALDAYVCGFEQSGTISVTARRGNDVAQKTVVVEQDTCHVITEELTLTLGS